MFYLPRAIGSLLFYPPTSDIAMNITNELDVFSEAYCWKNTQRAKELISLMKRDLNTANPYTFSVLFEGQGELVAPPWGSVYQHRDNLIMGESTTDYYHFLSKVGIALELPNQPLDHFALMLWVLASLCESENDEAIVELLSIHYLPWAFRYLELLSQNNTSLFYQHLALLTLLFLSQLSDEMGIDIKHVQLFK